MSQTKFAENADYRAYERLLIELHALIAAGKGDDEEADAVRERMDDPWYRLTRAEQARLDGLSADLYALSGEEVVREPVPPNLTQQELFEQIREYQQWNDWESVLGLLRRRPKGVPERAVALSRARAYDALGHADVALLFFGQVLRSGAAEPELQTLHLALLADAGRYDQAAALAEKCVSSAASTPSLLVYAAAALLQPFDRPEPQRAERALRILSEALARVSPATPILASDLVYAYQLGAHRLDVLGRRPEALATLDQALRVRPGDATVERWRDALLSTCVVSTAQLLASAGEKFRGTLWQREGRQITRAENVWGRAA